MNQKMTFVQFLTLTEGLSTEHRDAIWKLINTPPPTNTSLDIVDSSCECSMCGKPMPYRFCGMCTHCEMVWNG